MTSTDDSCSDPAERPPAASADPAGMPAPRSLSRPPWPKPVRMLMVALAVVLLGIGIVGLVVPGLPTTVFVLMAAWCAARGSPRFHDWLLAHRIFGSIIRDWQDGGRVSRRAKRSAALAMAVCAVVLLLVVAPPWSWVGITTMAVVLAWLWRRPEP